MKSRLGIALSWVLVFVLGAVAGAVGQYLYRNQVKPAVARAAQPKPGAFLEGVTKMLQLDDQQKESLKAILARGRERYKQLGQQYWPQWNTIRHETDDQIRSILRPDQQAKWDAFLKKVWSKPPANRPPQQQTQSNQ